MRIPRLYQDQPLVAGAQIELSDEAVNYLKNVLRLAEGHPLKLFNGLGGYFDAQISQVSKKSVRVSLGQQQLLEVESQLELTLAQCISRGERMDYTLQKAVELGISHIQPLFSERTQVKLDAERLERRQQHWQQIVISACEQSGRNRVPQVKPALRLADWLEQSQGQRLILSPEAQSSLSQTPLDPKLPLSLLIGPEGGLTDLEIDFACQRGCTPVRLGPRILRTETAALVALSLLQGQWGDLAG